jgi:5-methylcytosine-specific restriction protein A
MPKTRQPKEIWSLTRARIWWRDGGQCFRCRVLGIPGALPLEGCHIDHIQSGKLASNADSNLRVLCQYHHVLRLDQRHRGMIADALRKDLIPVNWREYLWE